MTSDNINDNIPLFYQISELDRQATLKLCKKVGISEDEYITEYSKTTTFTRQRLCDEVNKLFTLKEFQQLMIVYVVGLILILIFVK